tara:strand:- start:4473 stop:4775 length:303 start_codon:yes stop_codon:yes gene_type:complete
MSIKQNRKLFIENIKKMRSLKELSKSWDGSYSYDRSDIEKAERSVVNRMSRTIVAELNAFSKPNNLKKIPEEDRKAYSEGLLEAIKLVERIQSKPRTYGL